MQVFSELSPVKFQYRSAPEEESVGFIAEEVPGLVASSSRKSIFTNHEGIISNTCTFYYLIFPQGGNPIIVPLSKRIP